MVPDSISLRDGVRVDHVVQRVVQRAQVRVDLLGQRPGQEPEPLARLDRRAGQDDPVDLLGLEGLDGLGHRQVRLAGAGRADAERHRVGVDRVDVDLLPHRLGADRAAAAGQDVLGEHLGRPRGRGAQHLHRAGHDVPVERRAGAGDLDQLVEQAADQLDVARRAPHGHDVAAGVDPGAGEALLDGPQDLVARPEQRQRQVSGHDDPVLDASGGGAGGAGRWCGHGCGLAALALLGWGLHPKGPPRPWRGRLRPASNRAVRRRSRGRARGRPTARRACRC